jgi:hypothetical protein
MQHDGLQVAQDRETPVQVKRHAAFSWRYAYARAADTRKVGDSGQDYLTFRYNDDAFAFALCDGVSQSFFGDLAARFLGDALMDWLWQDLPNFPQEMNEQNIRTALTNNLNALAARSQPLVKNHPLPEGIPQMLRDVLEQKRAIGSETTFTCGRIDMPVADRPSGRVILTWMGDSRLRLWGQNRERTSELGDTFITEQRWSTHRGPVRGEPHVVVMPLENGAGRQLSKLMVYSDGLSSIDKYGESPSNKELNRIINAAAETAISDDISFLEIWLENKLSPVKDDHAAKPIPATIQHTQTVSTQTPLASVAAPAVAPAQAAVVPAPIPAAAPVLAPAQAITPPVQTTPATRDTQPSRLPWLVIAVVLLLGVLLVGAIWLLLTSQGAAVDTGSPTAIPAALTSPGGATVPVASPTAAPRTQARATPTSARANRSTLTAVVVAGTATRVSPARTSTLAPDTSAPLVSLTNTLASAGLCAFDGGVCVDKPFLEVWQTLGGTDKGNPGLAGLPLENAKRVNGVLTQRFERYTIYEDPISKPWGVEFYKLGVERYKQLHDGLIAPPAADIGCIWYPSTQHNICENYGYLQQRVRPLSREVDEKMLISLMFGDPISEVSNETINGEAAMVQWFEKARLEYYPDQPLGLRYKFGKLGSELSAANP